MIIGQQPQGAGVGLAQQQTATVTQPGVTQAASKIDLMIQRLGGVEVIEVAAAAMVEATKLELQLKALKKKYEVVEKNAKALASELEITDEVTLNGVKHSLVVTTKASTTNEIEDKKKLYAFLEEKTPGLYFQLSAIGIGELKNYVPDTAWSKAGLKVVPKSSVSVGGKVKA